MALTQITSEGIKDGEVKNADMADDAIGVAELSATGTASSSTFLRGDNSWQTISATDSTKMPLAGGTFTGDVTWDSATNAGRDMKWDESESDLTFNDAAYIKMGDSDDLTIGHNTYGFITQTGSKLVLGPTSNHSTELLYGNSKKFETKNDGVDITGELQCDSLDVDGAAEFSDADVTFYGADYHAYWDQSASYFQIEDNAKIVFGSSQDLQIYHTGSDSYIVDGGTGSLHIRGSNLYLADDDGTNMLYAANNAGVSLYHSGGKKFETTSNGVNINGDTTAETWDQNVLIVGTETLALGRAEANNAGPHLHFYKSRNGTWGSNTIVQDDDAIGNIIWYADDGTDYKSPAAMIQGAVDGTPGENDMPGRLAFYTSADGSDTNTERMRITKDGHTLFSGMTDANDTRNIKGISLKSPGGISFQNFGANGSRNWRIRPDDLAGWADLDFSCAPTDGATDIPDSANDNVLSLQGDTKDVKIVNGNLVIGTSGKGIDFSATADTTATGGSTSSELFDDYEEGTFTPVLGGQTNRSVYNISGAGDYIKIGKLVNCHIVFSNKDLNDSASGTVEIGGLPYTSAGVQYTVSSNHYMYNVDFNTSRIQSWYMDNSATTMKGIESIADDDWIGWPATDFNKSGLYLRIQMTYLAA